MSAKAQAALERGYTLARAATALNAYIHEHVSNAGPALAALQDVVGCAKSEFNEAYDHAYAEHEAEETAAKTQAGRQREEPFERCVTALERAGALVAVLTKRVSDEADDIPAVVTLETVSAIIEDASDELRAVQS